MNRLNRAVIAIAVCCAVLVAVPLLAQTPPAQTQPAAQPSKFISPIRGEAEIQVAPTKTVVKGNQVVTTIEVKNTAGAPIAGLKVDEYWWDKSGNPAAGGATQRLKKPLMPLEVATFTLEDVKDASMFRNTYQFSHAYGKIRTKQVKSLGTGAPAEEKKPATTKTTKKSTTKKK